MAFRNVHSRNVAEFYRHKNGRFGSSISLYGFINTLSEKGGIQTTRLSEVRAGCSSTGAKGRLHKWPITFALSRKRSQLKQKCFHFACLERYKGFNIYLFCHIITEFYLCIFFLWLLFTSPRQSMGAY